MSVDHPVGHSLAALWRMFSTGSARRVRDRAGAAPSTSRTGESDPARAVLEPLEPRVLLSVSSSLFDLSAASWLGGTATDDGVRGTVIQNDGTIVLAANLSDATPGGLAPTLLNNATSSSSGALVRLSADGTTVLSVTRLADKVLDLDADDQGNLYVALWTQGVAKLDAAATQVLWQKNSAALGIANVQRLDAGPAGYVAILGGGGLDDGSTLGNHVRIFDPAGTELGAVSDGKWKRDIALDESSQTVIFIGYRNATDSASGLPVQISYYRGIDFSGQIKYTGYDWSGSQYITDPETGEQVANPDYINLPSNNMADTRGHRAAIGEDGYLYLAFESAGGNFIFRYDPFDVSVSVPRAGGDQWHTASNTAANHITIFGRYDPATGAFLAGNEILTRLADGSGNTIRIENGDIAADSAGRVYLGGNSAWGLPLPTHSAYTFNPDRPGFNPGVNSNYLGGAWMMVMDPTLVNRVYTTRLTGDNTRSIAVRDLESGGVQLVFVGDSDDELYTLNPQQTANAGGKDGWFGVVADSAAAPGNAAPVASFVVNPVASGGGSVTVQFDASSSTDADGDPLLYLWHFGDGSSAAGPAIEHTFDATANRTITLTVLDDSTGWSQQSLTLGPPVASFTVTPAAATAPASITFNAAGTTDPDHTNAQLNFLWDFGDGTTATGANPSKVYAQGGIYTVTLTTTDPYGAADVEQRVIGIARDGGYSRRLDFQGTGNTTAPGFTPALVALYDPLLGFGYAHIDGDYASGSNGLDSLYGDYHSFSKYPTSPEDGVFLIDLPNGSYKAIARFSHKDGHSFPGLMVEGSRVLGETYAGSGRTDRVFDLTVTDGQIDVTLIGPYWSISSLEIIDVGPALRPDDTNSFTMDPGVGESPLTVLFNAAGYNHSTGLTYQWDFGDGNVGDGLNASHTYLAPGTYNVTLNVAGATSSRIIDFGGDYVTASDPIDGFVGNVAIDADNDGLADDSVRYIPIGLQPSAFLADVSAGGAKPSGRIFGGIASLRLDNANNAASFADKSITNNGANDYLNVRDQVASAPTHLHTALLMWIKEDFLAGAHAQRVYFDNDSQLAVSLLRWENLGGGRWVVQDGDALYVSQATFNGAGDHAIDPAATLWTTYEPGLYFDQNFDQAAAVYAAHAFTDIRAVGLLGERDSGAAARVWYQLDGFEVDAALAPASGTVTVIDPLPRVTVTATDTTGAETGGDAVFTIARTGPTTDPMTVTYSLSGNASVNDYTLNTPETGVIVIPAGQASVDLVITPVDDPYFEVDETLSILLTHQPQYYVDLPSSAAITIIDDENPFVNFGGDYVTASKKFRNTDPTLTLGDFDNDNGGVSDDARRAYAFSLANPLSPPVAVGSYSGTSAKFYGGAVGIAYNVATEVFDSASVVNNTSGDRPSMRFQASAGIRADFDTAWIWVNDDFLDDPNPKTLGAETTFHATFTNFKASTGRWLIGDGTQLYVSEATFTGTTTWTGQAVADSMWALYNPTDFNLDFDQAAAVFDVSISSIAVRAVGFITDADATIGQNHHVEFTKFWVEEGLNVPPPLATSQTEDPSESLAVDALATAVPLTSTAPPRPATLLRSPTSSWVFSRPAAFSARHPWIVPSTGLAQWARPTWWTTDAPQQG